MIFIRLSGGLGNQLFQLAAALHLRSKTNLSISFYTEHLKDYKTPREFMLKEILPEEFPLKFKKPSKLVQIILKYRVNKVFPFLFKWSITTKNIQKFQKSSFYVLDDYFQDISILKNETNIVAEYINQAAFNNKKTFNIYSTNNQFSNAVAIHIRRGDYLNKEYSKILVTQPDEYYNSTLNSFESNKYDIVAFTNEKIEDLKEITNLPIKFSNEFKLNDVEEFLLMSMFSNLIIANSTYSFWASIAAQKNNKVKTKVIAPSKWYYNEAENNIWLSNLILCNISIV